jgi:hypothetical protein
MRHVRSLAVGSMLCWLPAALLAACSSSAPDVAFSCTDAGVATTRQIAREVVDRLGSAYPASSAGHGSSHP